MTGMTGIAWTEDILGPEFSCTPLEVPRPDGTPRRATLIRHLTVDGTTGGDRVGNTDGTAGAAGPGRELGGAADISDGGKPAVLYLHGWSDYFFNVLLARFFTARGHRFYALDLHNHGRSLASPSLGGYVDDLADYDDEIRLAVAVLRADTGKDGPVILMGHSTGGLIAALWAAKSPAQVSHLILNSPWLEIQGGAAIRRTATPLIRPLADLRPLTRMRVPERSFYWRGISDEAYGEWAVDRRMRPPQAFPVRAGWMRAILSGQRSVAAGLGLAAPVLVLVSTRSMLGPVWNEDMLRADVVLDVRALALRALSLGNSVAVERIDGALHEVFLSPQPVRDDAYARLERWLNGYVPTPSRPAAR